MFAAMNSMSDMLSASFLSRIVIPVCLLIVFVLGGTGAAAADKQADPHPARKIQLVWSADYGKGEQIFFSRFNGKNWTIPVQISESKHLVFKPVSAVGADGTIWVVWPESGKKGSILQFSVYRNSSWSRPQPIETGLSDNRAVTVIVDGDNRPWIAWTGAKKSYSDVFWSRWNGTGWDAPVMAHAENKVPDLHPELALDDSGHLVLSWQTYARGEYITLSKVWDGRQWKIRRSGTGEKRGNIKMQTMEELPALPECIPEPYKATLFIKSNEGAGSIPFSRL